MVPFPVLSRPNFADLSSRFTLTLASSVGCSLSQGAKKVNSFGIKQIQPLFPKCRGGVGIPNASTGHPGVGYRHIFLLASTTFAKAFPGHVAVFASHQSRVTSHAPAPLFSYSCELPFLQAFYFHNDPHCPGVGAAFQERIHGKTRNLPRRRSPFNAVFRHSMHGNTV